MPTQLKERKRQKLPTQPASSLLNTGRLLRSARDKGMFADICALQLIHSRKAYDLIVIADAVDAGLLTSEDVETVGWSKARLIAAQAPTQAKARRAIVFARENTLAALSAYLRDGPQSGALITKSFHVSPTEAAEIEVALRKAGARLRGGRIENRAEAFMSIIRAYKVRKPFRLGLGAG